MCLAIVKKPEGVVPDLRLSNGWNNNRDGAGFAYVRSGKVVISKGYMVRDEFMAAYKKAAEENPASTFLIHFRIKTAGSTTVDNTHPFPVPTGALIHNGHFFTPSNSAGPSDTNIFAEGIGKLLKSKTEWFLSKDKVEKLIGRGSKVALLFDDGDHLILNESAGAWDDSVWYSNAWVANTGKTWTGYGPNSRGYN